MIFLVNDCTMLRLNDAQVNIGEFCTFLGGYTGVLVDPRREVLEEVGAGVDTHEVICGAYNH